jgi:hypothetical protein
MFGILAKSPPAAGTVLFRSRLPLRAEEFDFLRRHGVEMRPGKASSGVHWSLSLTHKDWGPAELMCLKEQPPLPAGIVDHAQNLSSAEKATAKTAGIGVSVRTPGATGDALVDRKHLLRYLGAVMGRDGVAAADHLSQLIWSTAALDDELSHDADADISALYTAHAVQDEAGQTCWLHTHGLAELGAFDFDVLRPSESFMDNCADPLRALAMAIVEERVKPSTARFPLLWPGGDIRLVPVEEFNRRGPADEVALREPEGDEAHNRNRAIVCDPGGGLLARLFRPVRASRFLSGQFPEQVVAPFSKDATQLMASRARHTLGVLKRLMEEFEEFAFPTMAKIGYETDGGGPDDREHLWFALHGIRGDVLDATLQSSPFRIAAMQAGQRGEHPVSRLTEWQMQTPMGTISPVGQSAARSIREHKDQVREIMREFSGEQGGAGSG